MAYVIDRPTNPAFSAGKMGVQY